MVEKDNQFNGEIFNYIELKKREAIASLLVQLWV